jgi:hypothetical protein
VPWQVEHEANEVCLECLPVDGGMVWQLPQACTGGVYVHDCDSTGLPPLQPAGDRPVTVRVWVPSGWQAPKAE